MTFYPIESDTIDAPFNMGDVTERDFEIAANNYAYVILNNGALWDENLEHHRMDLMLDIEAILFDNEDDKLGRMKDKKWHYANEYAIYAVKYLNGFYEEWRE